MSDTGVESVEPNPHCSWQGHSRRVGADFEDEVRRLIVFFNHSKLLCPECCAFVVVVRWNWWVVVQWVQVGALIWDVVHFHPVDSWALSELKASWRNMLETVWLLCDEAQHIGCRWRMSAVVASLLLRLKTTDTTFVVLSFNNFQIWRYSPTVAMSLLSTPSTACQFPSAYMIAGSLAYAYFLETVVSKLEVYTFKRKGARMDPCGIQMICG